MLAPEQPTSDAAPGSTALPTQGAPGTVTFLAAPPAPELPRRIGRYWIVELLGAGGQGIVYLGKHRYLGVHAAVKVMTVPMDRVRRRAFLREARRLVRLRGHPGIVELREFGLYRPGAGQAPAPYLATDPVPGGRPLTTYANEAGLDLGARLALFARVCDAVEHAHGLDVIHLDLKPGNILVVPGSAGRPACPKIIDFGLARAADPSHEILRTGLEGTLPYMSPEQTVAGSALDPRSDVYSLGVILYELLTGAMPYRLPAGHTEALKAIREATVEFGVGGLPAAAKAIIAKAMAKSPAERYASAGALGDDVWAYVGGGVPPGLRRNRGLRAVLGAGALCARRPRLAAALVVLASAALTLWVGVPLLYSWTGASNWFERTFAVPVAEGDRLADVVLVTPTEETEKARASGAGGPRSYRAVYGDLLKGMAAAPPRVVVFDHDMRGARPYDADFVAGVRAIWDAGCPVVLGTQEFDVGDNGLPREKVMSPTIAEAVSGWGDMGISADAEAPWAIALVYRWDDGLIDPALSLVAAAVATQNPAVAPHLYPRYELKDPRGPVVVHFVAPARTAAALVPPRPDLDLPIEVSEVRRAAENKRPPPRADWSGDAPLGAYVQVPLPSDEFMRRSTKTLEEVMANPEPCRGKIVLVFNAMSKDDWLPHAGGDRLGAYGQAMAIQSLVSQRITRRPNLAGQLLIPLVGAAVGLALPWPVVRRRSWWPRWAVAGSVAAWVGLTLIALAVGVAAARWLDYLFNPLVLVFAMVMTAVLWLGVDRLRRVYPLLKEARG